MIRPNYIVELFLLAAVLLPLGVHADVYKCKDAQGSLTYSQVPCASPEKTEKVTGVETKDKESATAECDYAVKFALSAAGAMKNGAGSDELFDLYGGLDSLSKGSIGVINYVYEFRPNTAVTAERIAALTEAKCEAGSLGDVGCADLPTQFTHRLGGCVAEAPQPLSMQTPAATQTASVMGTLEETMPLPVQETRQSQDAARRKSESDAKARAVQSSMQCKEKYQSDIEQLDEIMRSGYTSAEGEVFRERRRSLREKLSQC